MPGLKCTHCGWACFAPSLDNWESCLPPPQLCVADNWCSRKGTGYPQCGACHSLPGKISYLIFSFQWHFETEAQTTEMSTVLHDYSGMVATFVTEMYCFADSVFVNVTQSREVQSQKKNKTLTGKFKPAFIRWDAADGRWKIELSFTGSQATR